MLLIELFKDYVFNKKSLKEYIELRKDINERGEFNDQLLIRAEDNLQKLKKEDPQTYDLMYETLDEYVKRDRGSVIEYPINFIREVSKMYTSHLSVKEIYNNYKDGLNHPIQDF